MHLEINAFFAKVGNSEQLTPQRFVPKISTDGYMVAT